MNSSKLVFNLKARWKYCQLIPSGIGMYKIRISDSMFFIWIN